LLLRLRKWVRAIIAYLLGANCMEKRYGGRRKDGRAKRWGGKKMGGQKDGRAKRWEGKKMGGVSGGHKA